MQHEDQQHWQYLVEKYFANTITKDELTELLAIAASQDDDALNNALQQEWQKAGRKNKTHAVDWDKKFATIIDSSATMSPVVPMHARRKWHRISAAMIAALLIGGIVYQTWLSKQPAPSATIVTTDNQRTQDLQPGTNGAILTLSNGQHIVLDSAGNGVIAMQGSTKVISNRGTIQYDENGANADQASYNTLTTPRGKQFQLTLSDGTKVWLNAASSIRYPTVFTNKERNVEVTGEAYFEVTQNAHQPFTVSFTRKNNNTEERGQVQVLGTSFNINAYADEPAVVTTLLEGKVKVAANGSDVLLSPGEQARLHASGTIRTLKGIDTDAVVAWKNGYFSFNATDMATLMRQIARWYDVDITYAGAVPNRRFGGEISRNTNASQVLKIMEESQVHFKIEGKKIIVLP